MKQQACRVFGRQIYWGNNIKPQPLENIVVDDLIVNNLDYGGTNQIGADIKNMECTLHLEGCEIIEVEIY